MNKHDYYMMIAQTVSSKSSCVRRKVGAVIVKDGRIISTGYNGTPRHTENCNKGGCERCNSKNIEMGQDLVTCICIHAEENALLQCAYHGISCKDGVLYTTLMTCVQCTKHAINAGINKIVYNEKYVLDNISQKLLRKAKIKTMIYHMRI